MRATLKLDNVNHRFVFASPDFSLRFSIAPTIQKIDEVLEVDGSFIAFIANGEEEQIDLTALTSYLKLDWDFSKYEIDFIV